MFSALLASNIILFAVACPTETGSFGAHAEFSSKIFPSVDWTVVEGASPIGQPSREDALKQIDADIKSSIKQALVEFGAPSDGFEIKAIDFVPVTATALMTKCTTPVVPGEFGYWKRTVYNSCETADSLPLTFKVSVSTDEDLFESQWRAIAVKTQNKLEQKNIVFDENFVMVLK